MAVIGTGNQGTGDMRGFLKDPRVQVVAVCDLNKMSPGYWDGTIGGREPARSFVEWHYARDKRSGVFKGCSMHEDFREVLARKDIDAVLIAIPDHWHSIPVIMAAKAGKDIYGEKPLSLTIAEGRAMSNAVRENKRVFQTGSQQRSDARFRKRVNSYGMDESASFIPSHADCRPGFRTTRTMATALQRRRFLTDSTMRCGWDRHLRHTTVRRGVS